MNIRHVRIATVALALLTFLATAAPAVAGKAVERPFRENLEGHVTGMVISEVHGGETFGGRCSAPSQWISTMEGTGVISHLGRVTWSTEHCYQAATFTFTDAELVIIAANGDRLYGTYAGTMTGPTTFAEVMTITGGTGRFDGATGSVQETGWFDPATGYMEVTGIGTIVYDASNARGD